MEQSQKENANPTVHSVKSLVREVADRPDDDEFPEDIDALEVFEMIRHLNDPEHPLTLEQLNVVRPDSVEVDNRGNCVTVRFTPTIPHCSMATLIGLCIRVKLLRSMPPRFKVDVAVSPGSHSAEAAVNKQLADKERVAAAMENQHLLGVVHKCIAHTDRTQSDLVKWLEEQGAGA